MQFVMPSLGAGMEEGVLAAWRCAVGDHVDRGQIVAEVETEKGLIDVETFHAGTVRALLVEPGTKVPVGTALAEIDAAERSTPTQPTAPASSSPEMVSSERAAGAGAAGAGDVRATPGARQLARREGVDVRTVAPSGRHGTVTREDVASAKPPPGPARARISPAARRRAEALGVDVASLRPGPDGAVHLEQVESAPPTEPKRGAATGMRRAIAAAMSRSKREIPHYYLSHTVDLGSAVAWMEARNEARGLEGRLVVGALLLAAATRALKKVPELNARWTGESAPPLEGVNLGVAIALRGGGLVAPALVDAHALDLDALMTRLTDLVERARRGSLRSSELSAPTITVTSLGDRGVETVFGVIHPPQVAMVGVGKVVSRPWVVDGDVVARPTVTVSLAADHRVSDGHRGGLYLAEIERLLQHPEDL